MTKTITEWLSTSIIGELVESMTERIDEPERRVDELTATITKESE